MAFVELRVAGPTLAPEQIRRLQCEMLDVVSGSLCEARETIGILVEPAPAAGWTVGGQRPTTLAHVCVTATTGSSPEQKKVCVERVHRVLQLVLGGELTPFSHVVINDLPSDAWGYGGLTQAQRERAAGNLA